MVKSILLTPFLASLTATEEQVLTACVYILGILTVCLSISAAVIFRKATRFVRHKATATLTVAIKWNLYGEAVIAAGTLLFSLAAHYGWLSDWSLLTQSIIRITMFLSTGLTTLHLVFVLLMTHYPKNRRI